jgi:two-component system sensor histidine kinase KdpD
MDSRPDPDQLLNQIQRDLAREARGKLKIFLGYAAGVGKTYAMLEAAQQRHEEGLEVVVGYIETRGRAETDALLAGLEVIPRREFIYRGITLTEMDTDAILTRRPQIVLVDELAHTNAPGSRHARRYQEKQTVIIAVKDRGSSLPEAELENVFSKFFRLQPNNIGGTGLGLSIAKGIVEAHDGRIWAQNRPGGGAIFSMALPVTKENSSVDY